MRWRIPCAAILLALLGGCETAGRGIDAACQLFRPIYVSRADVLTEGTAVQIEAHNESGARVCGWGGSAPP